MKILLAVSALCAAAICALLFPDMKKILLLIPFALLALCLTGCTSGLAARLNKMPDGQFTRATLSETGKFTKTTISLEGVTKDNGVMSASKISVHHTNPWVLDFSFEADNYTAQLSAAAKKKTLPPLTADNSTPVPPAAFRAAVYPEPAPAPITAPEPK